MSETAAKKKGHFTWQDYRSWPDDERWEIIDGEAFAMTPGPSTRHQRIQGELSRQFGNHFNDRKREFFPAPTDVKLSEENLVQPDLLIVCDEEKIQPSHIEGAPTLVVEILSPTSIMHDRLRKMELYGRFGVMEVWLVTPYPWLVEIFVLDGERYRLQGTYSKEDTFRSPTFPDLEVDLVPVFDFPIDPDERINMVKEGRPGYGSS